MDGVHRAVDALPYREKAVKYLTRALADFMKQSGDR
jgi:hypothetical protein